VRYLQKLVYDGFKYNLQKDVNNYEQ
jgi:hypothetical protein